MIETYYAACYWGAREESLEQCTSRLFNFMECFTKLHHSFSTWLDVNAKGYKGYKAGVTRVLRINDVDEIRSLLLEDRATNDDGRVLEELGFSVFLTNKLNKEPGTSISVTCGCTVDGVPSCCVIDLPYGSGTGSEVLTTDVLTSIMNCLVSSWNPTWGIVQSGHYRRMIEPSSKQAARIGWLTYLSKSYGTIPSLGNDIQVQEMGQSGSLITLTRERFTVSNPTHLQLAAHASSVLSEAGVLDPVTYST